MKILFGTVLLSFMYISAGFRKSSKGSLEDPERKDPGKGALKLMERIFLDEEMSSRGHRKLSKCFVKPACLDEKRVNLLKGKQQLN